MKNKSSKLGFGLMRLPQMNDETIDMNHLITMVDTFMSEGMNYFDTSFGYHRGHSEIAFKKVVSMRFSRDLYYLADKMPVWNIKNENELEKIFQMQLRKTGVDYFDNYLIHSLNGELYKKCLDFKVFEFMKKMKKEGRINSWGFSFHGSFEDYSIIINNEEIDFVQLQINYFDWEERDAKKFYEYTYKKNIPIIIMEPIMGGMLANPPIETQNALKRFGFDGSFASLALRYVFSLPGVITVLSGMSNIDHLNENIRTLKNFNDISLKDKEIIKITIDFLKKYSAILCTSCKYCIECPVSIPIYDVFATYNKYLSNKDKDKFNKNNYLINSAKMCISCNHCREVCPQKIDIPRILKNICAKERK